MSDFPQLGKRLFIDGGHQSEFSHIAWGGSDSQFYAYIIGYKESADLIIKNALGDGTPHVLDTCLFPACFLYRQYIELVLKDLYLSFSEDNREEKIQTIKTVSHDIKKIWKKVVPIVEKYFPDEDNAPLIAVKDYLEQFAQEDKTSFAFRYPITKKLELIHKDERHINLVNLAERMKELESFLSAISVGISVRAESEAEMKADFESEMRSIMMDIERDYNDLNDNYDDIMRDYPF